jgi:hypothetical protein
MRIEYTGDGKVTRLEPFEDGRPPHGSGNWTSGNAKALSMWFRGDPSNAPGQMFAQLLSSVPSGHTAKLSYDGDPEYLTVPEWQE